MHGAGLNYSAERHTIGLLSAALVGGVFTGRLLVVFFGLILTDLGDAFVEGAILWCAWFSFPGEDIVL